MKKRISRIFIMLLACLLLIGGLPLTASAETLTTELFTLSETKNMGISIGYDTEPPSVEFIAPNGEIFGSKAISSGKMTKTDSGTALFFRIPNAKAGTWQIKYDKKGNSELDISYAPYATSIAIDKFTFSQENESSLRVQFSVSHSKKLYYTYTISAVLYENGEVKGQKELLNGSANTGKQQDVNVNLDKLSTYSSYKLMLEVDGEDNGVPVFDSKVSDKTFAYVDPYADAAPEGFFLEIGTVEGSLFIDWSQTYANYKKTLVAVFFDDATEPNYHNTFEAEYSQTEIGLDLSNTKKLRVEISYTDYYGKQSLVASRTVDLSLASKVTLKGEDVSNALSAEIAYDLTGLAGAPFKAILKVNETEEELQLKGKDSFSIQLAKHQNTVDLVWYLDEITAFRINKELYSDRTAPLLNLPGIGSKVVTDKTPYILTGYVDAGCTVTINGSEVAVDANGIFTTELPLVVGENDFTIIATSVTGNRTQQIITVEWVLPSAELDILFSGSGQFVVLLSYFPLFAAVALSVTLCLFILLSKKKFQNRKAVRGNKHAILALSADSTLLLSILCGIIALIFAALWIFISIKVNSAYFYDVVKNSNINEAYKLLTTRDKYMWSTIIAAGITALSIGGCIILKKLAKKAFITNDMPEEIITLEEPEKEN